jgi:lysophospholipase L1-like esterase
VSVPHASWLRVARWFAFVGALGVAYTQQAFAEEDDGDDAEVQAMIADAETAPPDAEEAIEEAVLKIDADATVTTDSTPVNGARRGDALVLGSSSVNQAFGRLIARELERRGYRVTRKGVSAAGLARPDFRDMNQILEELPISGSTAAVFVYLGMNDAQALWLRPGEQLAFGRTYLPWSDERWQGLYTQRAQEFFERICERGAQRAIVLLPVDVKRERLQRRLHRIRELQALAAKSSSCGVALSTSGDLGRFESGGTSLRRPDGLHLSSRGAQAVWRRIQADALRLVTTVEPRRESSGRGPWCSAACRLGQGLRFRPEPWAQLPDASSALAERAAGIDCTTTW